jgi:hypothetical protein
MLIRVDELSTGFILAINQCLNHQESIEDVGFVTTDPRYYVSVCAVSTFCEVLALTLSQ